MTRNKSYLPSNIAYETLEAQRRRVARDSKSPGQRTEVVTPWGTTARLLRLGDGALTARQERLARQRRDEDMEVDA